MKIPLILAQTGSGGAEYGASYGRAPQGSEGLDLLSRAVSQAGDVIARVEAQKRQQADKSAANENFALYQRDVTKFDENLKQTERDPDRYRQQMEEYEKNLRDQVGKTMSNGARTLFEQHVQAASPARTARIYVHSSQLFKDREQGRMVNTLDALSETAGLTPFDDVERFTQIGKDGERAIEANRNLNGDEATNKALIKWRQDVTTERARRHKDMDPQGFVAAMENGAYSGMDPDRREVMAEAARNKSDALKKEAEAKAEKYYKFIEDETRRQLQAQISQMDSEAAAGTLTVDRVESARMMRVFEYQPDDYRRLIKEARTEKDQPSDPGTLDEVDRLVHKAVPGISVERIDALRASGKLSRKDANAAKEKVIQRQDHLRTEGRTEANQEMGKAEQVLRAQLGITTLLDARLDHEDQVLLASGMKELIARAQAGGLGGTEKAVPVAMEIAERLAPIREKRVKAAPDVIRQTLRFPALDSASASQALEAAKASGQVDQAGYLAEVRKINELRRREIEAAQKPTQDFGRRK